MYKIKKGETRRRKTIKWSKVLCLGLVIALLFATPSMRADAGTIIRLKWDKYYCNLHMNVLETGFCQHVQLAAEFTSKTAKTPTDVFWNSTKTHYPTTVNLGATKVGNGYGRGTYTIYSTLLFDSMALQWKSRTCTIYIYGG